MESASNEVKAATVGFNLGGSNARTRRERRYTYGGLATGHARAAAGHDPGAIRPGVSGVSF